MRRNLMLVSLLVLVAVLASLLVGCSDTSTPAAPTSAPAAATTAPAPAATTAPAAGAAIERIQKAGKMIVLVDSTFAPMEFKDDKGNLVGFDVDMANEIAKALGVQVEFQSVAWDGIFPALLQGKGDMIISSVTITDERKKEMAFSKPYYAAGQAILVRADNNEIKGPEDLKGKVIAVQIDTTGQEAAEKIEGIKEMKKLDGGAEACIMTEQGKTEATVIDIMVAGYFVQQHDDVKLVSRTPFSKEDIGIAMRPADTDLVEKMNELIDKMQSDGTLAKIASKWGMGQ